MKTEIVEKEKVKERGIEMTIGREIDTEKVEWTEEVKTAVVKSSEMVETDMCRGYRDRMVTEAEVEIERTRVLMSKVGNGVDLKREVGVEEAEAQVEEALETEARMEIEVET